MKDNINNRDRTRVKWIMNDIGNKVLKFDKTYYFGVDDINYQVPIENSDFQFNNGDWLTWCDLLARLSEIFMAAELKSKLTIETPTATFCYPEYYNTKFKEEDAEIRSDRIDFMINKMAPPGNGLILSTYKVDESYIMYDKFNTPIQGIYTTWPFTTLYKWNLKDSWNEENTEDYVTFQKSEKRSSVINHAAHMETENALIEYLENNNIKIKYIDYSMKTEEIYNAILHAKAHISYLGASYWLACYLNTPVVLYGVRSYSPVYEEYGFSDFFGKHSSGPANATYPGVGIPVTYDQDSDGYNQFRSNPVPALDKISVIPVFQRQSHIDKSSSIKQIKESLHKFKIL